MNLLEIIALLVVALSALNGFHKGFVRKIASILSLVGSIVLVSLVLPYITQFLKDQTPVYPYLVEQCQSTVVSWVGQDAAQGLSGGDLLPQETQNQIIRSLPVPEFLQEQLVRYNNSEGYLSLGVSTFQDYVINYVASAILNILAFVLAVMLVHIAVWFVVRILDSLARVPGVNLVNRLAGCAVGLLQGLFLLCMFFLLCSVFETAPQGQTILKMVRESAVLNYIYETNLLLYIVMRAAAVFA